MHILFVLCSARVACRYASIRATRVVLCMTDLFLVWSYFCTVASCSTFAVVHACRDPCLPVPLFYALVGPLPCSRTSQ